MQYEYSATHDSWLREAISNKDKQKHIDGWRSRYESVDRDLNLSDFRLTPQLSDLDRLPSLSFMLRVPFKLRKPYLSKDDRAFHLLDNPVRKDKVFQTPMVASTSWKGALHSAMLQKLVEWWSGLDEPQRSDRIHRKRFVAWRIGIARLFGTEKGVEIDSQDFESYLDNPSDSHLAYWYRRYVRRHLSKTGFFSGCLYFYPTFFDKIGVEVINPHDRKKGTGKNPILIESVPIGATGDFILLYVPFGTVQASQVAEDLKLVAEGVQAMLTVYGFGAKTSSGFGVAELNGKIEFGIRADWPWSTQSATEVKISEPELPRYLIAPGQLHPDFLNADGSFKSEIDYLQRKSGKKAKQLYQKAKDWWEREGRQLAEAPVSNTIPEPEALPSKPSVPQLSFTDWSELSDRIQSITQHLQEEQR